MSKSLFSLEENNSRSFSHIVLVSVAPYKFFVEKIAGDSVQIGIMVPAGASIHTYEPTPKEMLAAGNADIWFTIGESFEAKAIKALKSHNPKMKLIDLKEGVDLIGSQCHHKGCDHGADLHIWLSPKQAKIQAENIAKALILLYPHQKANYEKNLHGLLNELDILDQDIATLLKPLKQRTLLVSHPAYGYFCRDYSLVQLSVEFEGKDPTPQQLTKLLEVARKSKVKTVFIQKQYNNKGARLIAEYLGAKVVNLDPYSENYSESMRFIARQIASQENE